MGYRLTSRAIPHLSNRLLQGCVPFSQASNRAQDAFRRNVRPTIDQSWQPIGYRY